MLSVAQQPTAQDTKAQLITIRVLNGKTGKPVKDETPVVLIGSVRDFVKPVTDSNGEIHVPIGPEHLGTLMWFPNHYWDCRYGHRQHSNPRTLYLRDEIISKGIVAENSCGKAHAISVPGTIVIYVRNLTFWEVLRTKMIDD